MIREVFYFRWKGGWRQGKKQWGRHTPCVPTLLFALFFTSGERASERKKNNINFRRDLICKTEYLKPIVIWPNIRITKTQKLPDQLQRDKHFTGKTFFCSLFILECLWRGGRSDFLTPSYVYLVSFVRNTTKMSREYSQPLPHSNIPVRSQ